MKYLLDSDTVADWLNQQPIVVATLTRLLVDGFAISVITYSEIMEGILGGRNPRNAMRAFRGFLQGVRVIPMNRTVSLRHAQVRVELRRNKRQVNERALDLIIAATALTHDLTLATSNRRRYQDIPGLLLLNPRSTHSSRSS